MQLSSRNWRTRIEFTPWDKEIVVSLRKFKFSEFKLNRRNQIVIFIRIRGAPRSFTIRGSNNFEINFIFEFPLLCRSRRRSWNFQQFLNDQTIRFLIPHFTILQSLSLRFSNFLSSFLFCFGASCSCISPPLSFLMNFVGLHRNLSGSKSTRYFISDSGEERKKLGEMLTKTSPHVSSI